MHAHTWAFYRLIRWLLPGCTAGSAPVLSIITYYYQLDWPPSQTPNNSVHSARVRMVEKLSLCSAGLFTVFAAWQVNCYIKSFWLADVVLPVQPWCHPAKLRCIMGQCRVFVKACRACGESNCSLSQKNNNILTDHRVIFERKATFPVWRRVLRCQHCCCFVWHSCWETTYCMCQANFSHVRNSFMNLNGIELNQKCSEGVHISAALKML